MVANNYFGAQVSRQRKLANMTMEELANRCGVTKSSVWHWEKEGRVPQADTLLLIAKNLGVKVDDLINPSAIIPKTEPTAYEILDSLDEKQLEKARQILKLVFSDKLNEIAADKTQYQEEGSEMFDDEYYG